jgi:hypothetical protein
MSRISFGMMEAGYIPGDLGAFKKEGGKIKLYDDSSSGGAPTSQSITQTSIPEYARPYVEKYLGKAEALADLGYQPYGGQRMAAFDPFQLQAQQNVANMQTAQQLGTATQMAGLAGLRAGNMNYDPRQFSNTYNAPVAFQETQFSNTYRAPRSFQAGQFTPTSLQQFQMQQPGDVSTGRFTDPDVMQQYMSPYQQAVTDIDKREAMRQSGILQQQNQARAVQQGAFGGSGSALTESARQRALAEQMGDIQARGSQAAFQQGSQQFQMDQQRALQAALANQQMGFGTGQQNLAAQLGVQQLGSQQALEAQRMGEQSRQFGFGQDMNAAELAARYGLSAQQAAEQSKQFGYGQRMNAAEQAARYGLSAQQADEQSRQFGANFGMQGLQQQLAAAGLLGNLGQMEFGQQKDIINALNAAGSQRQALEQGRLDMDYQDFLRQQQYPYQQLGFMFDALRGLPLGQYSQMNYMKDPSLLSQGAGAALLAKRFDLFAEGGEVKDAPAGLADLAIMKMGS